jgi:hypothetical protein
MPRLELPATDVPGGFLLNGHCSFYDILELIGENQLDAIVTLDDDLMRSPSARGLVPLCEFISVGELASGLHRA